MLSQLPTLAHLVLGLAGLQSRGRRRNKGPANWMLRVEGPSDCWDGLVVPSLNQITIVRWSLQLFLAIRRMACAQDALCLILPSLRSFHVDLDQISRPPVGFWLSNTLYNNIEVTLAQSIMHHCILNVELSLINSQVSSSPCFKKESCHKQLGNCPCKWQAHRISKRVRKATAKVLRQPTGAVVLLDSLSDHQESLSLEVGLAELYALAYWCIECTVEDIDVLGAARCHCLPSRGGLALSLLRPAPGHVDT